MVHQHFFGRVQLITNTNLRVIQQGGDYAVDDKEEDFLIVYQVREE